MTTTDYSRQELIEKASLTSEDMEQINQCRRNYNRLGFAYQIGFVRLVNRFPLAGVAVSNFPTQHPFEIIDDLLTFTSVQLQLDQSLINQYAQRQQTISQHQIRILDYLKLKRFYEEQRQLLQQFLFEESCRLEQTNALFLRAEQFLQEQGILRPATSTIERIIGEQRTEASQYIFRRITDALEEGVANKLDNLLLVGDTTRSSLAILKEPPGAPSAPAMKILTEKLARIEETGVLEINLSWLNNNYQRSLASYVRKCDAHRLREVESFHRYGALVCFLRQNYQDTIDFIIDMHDKLINKAEKNAKKGFDEELKRRRQSILSSLGMFQTVAGVILDKTVDDKNVRQVVFSQVPSDILAQQISQLDDWVTGKRGHQFSAFIGQFNYLRKFSPAFLKSLQFEDSHGTDTPLNRATELLREMNATNKRKLPEDAPTEFVSKTIRPLVVSDGVIDKHAWECALIRKIRDEVKVGNISVKNSKRFGAFDRFFISDTKWSSLREEFFAQSGLPQKGCDAATYFSEQLNLAYDKFLETLPNNTYAQVDGAGWHLSVDSAEPPDPTVETKIDQLKNWIKKHQRQIKLPQLLIEVDNELHFTRHFLPPAQSQIRPIDEIITIIAAIMAHGCNIGPETMSQLTTGVTYEQIRRITEWQLIEENQRSALADVVNAIACLETSLNWGEGKTSASDGQRFAFRRQVLQQNYSHKFSDYALEFYSFVADNYAPYYVVPIECNERDAPYVLDGILYNESDLQLEEHYTDTHGYTEINFAAFAMLGKEFCPRIRKISNQRIYRIDPNRDYGALAPLFNRKGRTTIKMDWIVDQWDRMGQFYATLKSGHTTASVALKRLNSMSKSNQFYRANRELGRIKKTEFILKYMSLPPLRRRIRRGLLKVDQLHSLSRDVAYAKQGRITKRDFYEIMKSCSCLTLILACIIYWQAKEIGRVISECNPEEEGVDISLLEHVSPIEWENVVLYGEYLIDRSWIR